MHPAILAATAATIAVGALVAKRHCELVDACALLSARLHHRDVNQYEAGRAARDAWRAAPCPKTARAYLASVQLVNPQASGTAAMAAATLLNDLECVIPGSLTLRHQRKVGAQVKTLLALMQR